MTAIARRPITQAAQREVGLESPSSTRGRNVVPLPVRHGNRAVSPTFALEPQASFSSDGGLTDIVVAVDDRSSMDRALTTATQLTRQLGVALRLVSVHRRNGTGAEYSWRRAILDDTQRSLVTRHPDLVGHIDTRVLVDGDDCALCEQYPRSITVTATERAPHHAERVVRLSAKKFGWGADHHPMIVVGPNANSEWRPGPIAIALDGSPLGGSTLAAAAAWATALGVDLEVLKVLSSAKSALSHAETRQHLRAARREVDDDALRIRLHTVASGDAASAVARFLRDHRCPLVGVATPRARDDNGNWSIDDETIRLIAQSPCPVWLR